jgi:phosphatidate cytidylyltransferase
MTRLLSGVVLAAAALAAIIFLPTFWLRLMAAVVALLAGREYRRIVGGSVRVDVATGIACLVISEPMAQWDPLGVLLLFVGFGIAATVLRGEPVQTAAAEMLALTYIGLPLGLLVLVHGLAGREAVLLLLFTVVASDSGQYYTGRLFGRHALAPSISPKKTIEGAVGGAAIGTAFFVGAGRFVLPFAGTAMLVGGGVAIVLAGIAGDLFESRLKRDADLKDSSDLIPGHGGVLDRIDALLFAAPVFYVFLNEVM